MFDVFYKGPKPGLFPFELPADSLEEAAGLSRTKFFWFINGYNDYTNFDFNYRSVPWEEAFIHVWPSQWQTDSETYFANKWTIESKQWHFKNANPVVRRNCLDNWVVPDNINADTVDYSWHANTQDPPFIYHFPVKWGWGNVGGVEYHVPGATEHKYIDVIIAETQGNQDYWSIPDNIDPNSIDYSWTPNPADPPLIYQFPVKWGWDRIGGPEYRVPGATDVKFVDDFYARTRSDMTLWRVPANIDKDSFDFSWAPHPAEEPYIYKFPTVWNAVGGPEYRVPGATKEKYIDVLVARTLPDRTLWTIPEEVNADTVDFGWVPHPQDPPYIYHFGTEFQSSIGLIYTVPGATEVKFAGDIPVIGQHDKPVLEILDIFFVNQSNKMSNKRLAELQERYPHVQSIRFANSMIDTIKRCITRAKTNKFWVVSSENIYTDFNFEWHAEPWQNYMTHVFGSQWQKWSDTFLINKWEFERNSQWAKSLEEFPNLNFVSAQPVYRPADLHDIYYVDHGNDVTDYELSQLTIKRTRYVDNYLDTFKRIMSTATTEYVWIISSLCDYRLFDFSWQPEPWQKEMIHVFPSANQSRGDTFYIHVESFKQQMVELEMLDWFNVINYCEEQRVPRLPIPVCEYKGDDLITVIKEHEFKHPYTWFCNRDRGIVYNPSIWGAKDKKIVTFSAGNSYILAPRDAKNFINTQVYDYSYIEKMRMFIENPLDIIYISNGEPDAERWYEHLISTVDLTRRSVKRVQNVNGRANAYKAAAELSTTPWFFAVFAKLEVNTDFDWDWQPDYLQGPKHYIFHSKNPVNGLEYGHMGVIAYNKQLVQDTHVWGLDFTLSKPHAVVPLLSATAHYNTTPELTWRTAFRECIKLLEDVNTTGSIESQSRLDTWLGIAEGEHSMWSLLGARDAIEYYNMCKTHEYYYEFLMKSFEWKWLGDYYASIYTPNATFTNYTDESNPQLIQLPDPLTLDKSEYSDKSD